MTETLSEQLADYRAGWRARVPADKQTLMDQHVAHPAATGTFGTRTDAWGYLAGGVLALGALLSFAAARAGVINGLTPGDLIPMWFGVAGIVLLPLLHWDLPTLAAIGRRRGLVLTGRGGPPSCVTATDDQHAVMRGLVHGVILSMVVWTAAFYLTLALR
jgi:hypothetical protein